MNQDASPTVEDSICSSSLLEEIVAFNVAIAVTRCYFVVIMNLTSYLLESNSKELAEKLNAVNTQYHGSNPELMVNEVFLGHGLCNTKIRGFLQSEYGWKFLSDNNSSENMSVPYIGKQFTEIKYHPFFKLPSAKKIQKKMFTSEILQLHAYKFSNSIAITDHQIEIIRDLKNAILSKAFGINAISKFQKLSDIKTPDFLMYSMSMAGELTDKINILETTNENQNKEIDTLQSVIDEMPNKLIETILEEITALESSLKTKYNSSIKSLSNNKEITNNLAEVLLESVTRDFTKCKTLFRILVPLILSTKDLEQINNPKNINTKAEIWQHIFSGYDKVTNDLFCHYNGRDPDHTKIAAKCEIVRSIADLLFHIIINARQKGQCPSEWIFSLTTLLKDYGLEAQGFNHMNKFHLTYSNSIAKYSRTEDLQEFYHKTLQDLGKKVTEKIDSSNINKANLPILIVDNFNKNRYASEQKQNVQFTRSSVTTSALVKLITKRQDFNIEEKRPAACTTLESSKLDKTMETLKNGKTDLKEQFQESNGEPIIDVTPCHLDDFTNIASLPLNSDHHPSQIQLNEMMHNYLDCESGNHEILSPTDPAFVLQAIPWVVTNFDRYKQHVQTWPIFHTQKHLLESNTKQPVFMRVIKGSFYNMIENKPSIFKSIIADLDNINVGAATNRSSLMTLPTTSLVASDQNIEDNTNATNDENPNGDAMNDPELHDQLKELIDGLDVVVCQEDEMICLQSNKVQMQNHGLECVEETSNNLIRNLVQIINRWEKQLKYEKIRNAFEIENRSLKTKNEKEDHKKTNEQNLKIELHHANKVSMEKKLMDTTIMNFQRLKYLDELLYAIYENALEDMELKDLWEKNSLTKLVKRLLGENLHIGVYPFNELNGKGNMKPFLEMTPMFARQFAIGKKPKISKMAIFLQTQSEHLVQYRPDVLRQIGSNCTSLNEIFIEHHHSCMQRLSERQGRRWDDQQARYVSIEVSKKRKSNVAFNNLFQMGPDGPMKKKASKKTSTQRDDSEPMQQVKRFNVGGSEFGYVLDLKEFWFKPLLQSFAGIVIAQEDAEVLDNYLPLEWENVEKYLENVKSALDKEITRIENTEKKLKDREMKYNNMSEEDLASLREQQELERKQKQEKDIPSSKNELTYYMDKSVSKINIKKVASFLNAQPDIYSYMFNDESTTQENNLRKATQSNGSKEDAIFALEPFLITPSPELPTGTSMETSDAIEVFIAICESLNVTRNTVKNPFNLYKEKKTNPPKPKISYHQMSELAPSHETGKNIIETLKWKEEYKFPFTQKI